MVVLLVRFGKCDSYLNMVLVLFQFCLTCLLRLLLVLLISYYLEVLCNNSKEVPIDFHRYVNEMVVHM